jgi:hypothetical protein
MKHVYDMYVRSEWLRRNEIIKTDMQDKTLKGGQEMQNYYEKNCFAIDHRAKDEHSWMHGVQQQHNAAQTTQLYICVYKKYIEKTYFSAGNK